MSISDSGQYDLLDQLAEEFAERFRRGERPSLKEYTDRYPELADEIRELFPAMVKVEQAEDLRQVEEETSDPRPAKLSPNQIFREVGPVRASLVNQAEQPSLGHKIGDYQILREIGRGGMGVVYEAEQISLGRRVALKVLPRQVSGDRMTQERFRREARAAARLYHTNIVPVFEIGQEGEVRYYAMQFIQGQGLDLVITELRRLRDRARSEPQIKAVVEGQSRRTRGEHSGQGIEDPTLGKGGEVSAVLQSILAGRFDPGGRWPEPVAAPQSSLAGARTGSLATPTGTGTKSGVAESDPAQTRTETGSATPGDTTGPGREHPPAPALLSSASPSSNSTILPGGTQLSSVESGRRAFYRSLAHIGRQVAGGLAYAHARGIVHRDIKPANLLLDTEGVVWIADFGLAKGEDEGLTHTGDILGTIRYMAPERLRGEGDARADVYALGLTLYELLTLRSGFESSDRLKLIEQIKTEEPKKPRAVEARIPRDLETIVLKAIDKDPKARYQTAEAMGEDLGRFLADEPIRARQVSAAERYWRWAGRNPVIAVLGGVLTALLVAATVGSILPESSRSRRRGRATGHHRVREGSAKRESRTMGALSVEHRRRVRLFAASEQRRRAQRPRRRARGAPQLGMAVPR
jgi:eukaryotic-like serine/threonine-protein kinase